MTSHLKNNRRIVLQSILGTSTIALGGMHQILSYAQAPALITSDKNRPKSPSGTQTGDVNTNSGILWSRSDREAKMWVTWDTTQSFSNPKVLSGPYALESTDFTSRVDLRGLPSGQDIFYKVTYEDLKTGAKSQEDMGHFRTSPAQKKSIRFLWYGDTAGQGWGINTDLGGMTIYESMRKLNPDFFIHSGDNIYADGPIKAEVTISEGPLKGLVWKNIVTEEKSKVAQTLKEFRGNYRYNMMDENVRRFNSEIAQIWQWDDHEVLNNYPSSKDVSADTRYTEKKVPLLVARATRAFLENAPMRWYSQQEEERIYRKISQGPLLDIFVIDMRSYRGGNSYNRQETLNAESQYLGPVQIEWLKTELKNSKAVWKVIASDMPLGLLVEDGKDEQGRMKFEAVANGNGPALGREIEIADILSHIKRQKIRNTVWLTADTHYTAAHYFNPNLAQFSDFDPFWEFMTGPLSSGTFGPNQPDNTFGVEVKFQKAPTDGRINLSPAKGYQFFGDIQIDGKTSELLVDLRDSKGVSLWSTKLQPKFV
jgi:alkaline phosphatase D